MERITAMLSCTIMTENEHLYFAGKYSIFFFLTKPFWNYLISLRFFHRRQSNERTIIYDKNIFVLFCSPLVYSQRPSLSDYPASENVIYVHTTGRQFLYTRSYTVQRLQVDTRKFRFMKQNVLFECQTFDTISHSTCERNNSLRKL